MTIPETEQDLGGMDLSAKTPVGEISAKNVRLRLVEVLVAVIGALALYMFYIHMADTKMLRREEIAERRESAGQISAAIREFTKSQQALTDAQNQTTRAMKLQTCIMTLDVAKRPAEFKYEDSYCDRMSK